MGCRDCKHHYQEHGDPKCDLEPFNNPRQQAGVIRWLQNPMVEPHVDDGCPGFEDFRERISVT